MTVQLPPDAYGPQTKDIQQILSNAGDLSLFVPHRRLERAAVAGLIEAHLAALTLEGADVPPVFGVRLFGGGSEALGLTWSKGESWRETIGIALGGLQGRHASDPRLLPPIWPIGAINVFGVTLVATESAWDRCGRIGSTSKERDTCWECVCFAEKIVDALLVAALSRDPVGDVFSPILSLMRGGWIPIGYVDGLFTCLEFGADPVASGETLPIRL